MGWFSDLHEVVRRAFHRAPKQLATPLLPVDALIARMERIAASSDDADGLAHFNRMYLSVTRAVQWRIATGGFRDAAYMERLTGVFGGLYLEAVATAEAGTNKAWAPLLECRHDGGRLPVQFALAGMNAHINYDLPIAVVRTCRQVGTDLGPAVAADYRAITGLLAEQQEAVRRSFLDGVALEVDRHLAGPVADLVGSWSITRARDAAWTNAQVLWELDRVKPLEREFLGTLGRTVGLAGRLLLTPLTELTDAHPAEPQEQVLR